MLFFKNKMACFPAMNTHPTRFPQFLCSQFEILCACVTMYLFNLKHWIQLLNGIVSCPTATLKGTQDELNKKALQTLERWVGILQVLALCISLDEFRIIAGFNVVFLLRKAYLPENLKNGSVDFSNSLSKPSLWWLNAVIIWLNIQGKSTCSATKQQEP